MLERMEMMNGCVRVVGRVRERKKKEERRARCEREGKGCEWCVWGMWWSGLS